MQAFPAAEHGVSIDHCFAIGVSLSDLPLFAAVDTKDLRDVIPWLKSGKAGLH
ncbi:hypothetical protein [Citricoccus sp. NR2]|uniref:hypothetical protein n=1 Tax=Citricoccus sp. NR2 TaxID=3004095 RepID=UPI0022DDC5C4|nr:hypothetical protein [Citricoccus sp. NR2]WBL18438.1 hypothetical protein O1A05_11795 [Citricoccus sp. NR2]